MERHAHLRRVGVRLGLTLLALGASSGVAAPLAGADVTATPSQTLVTNGPVDSIVVSGDTTYIGGSFSQVGPWTGPGVGLDGAGHNTGLPAVSGGRARISAVASDTLGGWYIAGSFTSVGGTPRANLAHIAANGAVDPAWHPDANGPVGALAVTPTAVYAGGGFTSIGGAPRSHIAALNPVDGLATPWAPNADGAVNALAVSGTTVYAGGSFGSIGGQARRRIAALDATGVATSWDPNANGAVLALAVSGTTLYVGGTFHDNLSSLGSVPPKGGTPDAGIPTIGGADRNYAAALSTATGLALPWNPDADSAVSALAAVSVPDTGGQSSTTVYAGGAFHSIGGQTRDHVAKLDGTTGLATAWAPNANGDVAALAVSGTTVYAGGAFKTIGGTARNNVAGVDTTTGQATNWNPNPNAAVEALAVSGSTVYAGGAFSSVGGVARSNVAAMDRRTGQATGWDPRADSDVISLAISGSTVYAGGNFSAIGGHDRSHIAALDGSGQATPWNPGADGAVDTLAVSGSTVYAGGDFAVLAGQARDHIGAVDEMGNATAWNPGADGAVEALAISGSTVYAGGWFAKVGGQRRNNIAALDTSGNATGWNPDANGGIRALAVSGSTVYAGGWFGTIGDQARNNIAALDGAGNATSWDPNADGGVEALVVSGETVFAGGSFSSIGGQARQHLAALDPGAGSALGWDPHPDGTRVGALAIGSDGSLFAGGDFNGFALGAQQSLAQFQALPDTTTPRASIAAPTAGGVYEQGSALTASYSCADSARGSGIKSCTGQLESGAPVANGDTLDTSRGHTLTVTATDFAGKVATTAATYTVADTIKPSATIATPADNAVYEQGSAVTAAYSCDDNAGGSGIDSCTGRLEDGTAIANGDVLDTGHGHTLTVTATDRAGNTDTRSATYTVAASNRGSQQQTASGTDTGAGRQENHDQAPVSPATQVPTLGGRPPAPCAKERGSARRLCLAGLRHASILRGCERLRTPGKRTACVRAENLAYRRARAMIRCGNLDRHGRALCVRRARRLK